MNEPDGVCITKQVAAPHAGWEANTGLHLISWTFECNINEVFSVD